MGISRPTFSRLLAEARGIVARGLVDGWAIRIDGGMPLLTDAETPVAPGQRRCRRGRGFGMPSPVSATAENAGEQARAGRRTQPARPKRSPACPPTQAARMTDSGCAAFKPSGGDVMPGLNGTGPMSAGQGTGGGFGGCVSKTGYAADGTRGRGGRRGPGWAAGGRGLTPVREGSERQRSRRFRQPAEQHRRSPVRRWKNSLAGRNSRPESPPRSPGTPTRRFYLTFGLI